MGVGSNRIPNWNPDVSAQLRSMKVAYNPEYGEWWEWEANKIAPSNGAWVKRGVVSILAASGPPTHTPTNPGEVIIDSNGLSWTWNGTFWTTDSNYHKYR